jgi:hypothetical protein
LELSKHKKNPRSRILRVLYLRQKRYALNWPTLMAHLAKLLSRHAGTVARPELFHFVVYTRTIFRHRDFISDTFVFILL